MSKNTGGPAFPFAGESGHCLNDSGMTLRDYFAAKAMQSIYADVRGQGWQKECAKCAYELADAMLEARK